MKLIKYVIKIWIYTFQSIIGCDPIFTGVHQPPLQLDDQSPDEISKVSFTKPYSKDSAILGKLIKNATNSSNNNNDQWLTFYKQYLIK